MQSEITQKYFTILEKDIQLNYEIANLARSKGLDPKDKVEIPLARSLAEKVVGLIATIYPQMNGSGIAERILELEEVYGKLDTTVSFKIAEEVAKQKFCKFSSLLEGIDAGIRVGFSYTTLGVVSSPIEGYTQIKIGKRRDGKEYLVAYFSGPIRSAGTTASCIVLMLIDYLRELFGYEKYDPSEEEIRRYVSENQDYHERITNLQYMPTEEEILFLAKNLPIQIAGEPTEKLEVSNYKNLERVETDNIRGGMCLIFSEGLAQKAAKGYRLLNGAKKNGIKSSGFDFLEEYIKIHDKRKKASGSDSSPTYIKDLVAGRPIFGHPSKSGGFRFRYGRSRSSGFSAASLHPATMAITDDFIAIGTQLKIEKPTKGCAIASCDSIEGPIIKLNNGSVIKVKTASESKKFYSDIHEILYLGDILFPFSDVANRNHSLIKPGYVEEWWHLELEEKNKEKSLEIDPRNVSFEEACALSKKYEIALHPNYIFFWTQISMEEFVGLIEWLKKSTIRGKKIVLPFTKSDEEKYSDGKRALELLGVEHIVTIENVVINEERSKCLMVNLGIDTILLENEEYDLIEIFENLVVNKDMTVFELINILSEYNIKDLAGDFVGTRMGRPEKAKLRKLIGSPHVLFPVGSEGGRLRSVQAACEIGKVKSSFPLLYCQNCKKETIYHSCETCKQKSVQMYYCSECKQKYFEICKEHNKGSKFSYQDIDVRNYLKSACEHLNLNQKDMPVLIKGVRGTSSSDHITENLAKGILRSHFNLQVNKDGTIRYDVTELPVTHFKGKEISTSVEKLKELGYQKDIYGKELTDENQIIEMMPHDIILPCCYDSPDERADTVFINVANFIDSLLERFYNLPPFYNIKSKEDLVGKLGVCMAPHNCAGVICRFIGFSNTQGGMASPYMHAAIRRDCDGDEMAIMLLLDVLINFSLSFLPSHRGGTQDAPLVLNGKIDAGEVDDQILDLEMTMRYPLELYRLSEKRVHSSEVDIYNVKKCLREGKDPFIDVGFTHDTTNFNDGVLCSNYKKFATMQEKVDHQMKLVEKIRAADTSDTAKLIIERHFIRDMKGNLRKFSMQQFRCVQCNESIRRPPLSGVCPMCGGKIIFTIHEGGIKKYLEPAFDLAEKYDLSPYIKQSLELTRRYIDSVFGKELEKQEALKKWF